MKKRIFASVMLIMFLLSSLMSYGAEGEIGFFGGVSTGDYLPKTIEKYVPTTQPTSSTYTYKEVLFITGEPIEVTGTITVAIGKVDLVKNPTGTYREQYTVSATNKSKNVTLSRNIQLRTAYKLDEGDFKKQIVKDSYLTSWSESITTDNGSYALDPTTAIFSKATVEDITPGVTYYATTISYSGTFNDADGNELLVNVDGDSKGYRQPWSKVETQHLTMGIRSAALGLSMDIQINPRLEAKKTIYYDENQPFPISFGGTYNQRMEREGTLDYEILSYHKELTPSQLSNSIVLTTANQVEKLPIPEGLDFLEGHWAEEDMKKLYSMEILTGTPHQGMQYEAMSRGDYVKTLCLALNIDTTGYEGLTSSAPQMFGDVPYNHPLYPYIMAAYDSKLVKGTGENFDVNLPITREEAFVIYIRVIGLERLGVTNSPTTPFVDDSSISSWAKREIVAGYRLGIIKGTAEGKVLPKQWISKPEAAAIVSRLIDYLRAEIGVDY